MIVMILIICEHECLGYTNLEKVYPLNGRIWHLSTDAAESCRMAGALLRDRWRGFKFANRIYNLKHRTENMLIILKFMYFYALNNVNV